MQPFMKIVVAAALSVSAAQAISVEKCGNETSAGNPMPCSNGGNCTWWTWKKANEAGWAKIPTGNANTWDDTAAANKKLFVSSTSPTVGSVAVKESSPYCVAKDAKGKCTKYADTGHVAWVTAVNGTDIETTESNYGVFGVQSKTRKSSYFGTYIRNTDGQLASTIGCSDAKILNTKRDSAGNTISLYSSADCKSRWTVAVAKNPTDLVIATVERSSPVGTQSNAGRGSAVSPMVQVIGSATACTSGKFKSVTAPKVCG